MKDTPLTSPPPSFPSNQQRTGKTNISRNSLYLLPAPPDLIHEIAKNKITPPKSPPPPPPCPFVLRITRRQPPQTVPHPQKLSFPSLSPYTQTSLEKPGMRDSFLQPSLLPPPPRHPEEEEKRTSKNSSPPSLASPAFPPPLTSIQNKQELLFNPFPPNFPPPPPSYSRVENAQGYSSLFPPATSPSKTALRKKEEKQPPSPPCASPSPRCASRKKKRKQKTSTEIAPPHLLSPPIMIVTKHNSRRKSPTLAYPPSYLLLARPAPASRTDENERLNLHPLAPHSLLSTSEDGKKQGDGVCTSNTTTPPCPYLMQKDKNKDRQHTILSRSGPGRNTYCPSLLAHRPNLHPLLPI